MGGQFEIFLDLDWFPKNFVLLLIIISLLFYGLHNYSLRNENGEAKFDNHHTIRNGAHLPTQYALKIINYQEITFVCSSVDIDYFVAGRKFKFVKCLNFRFPKEQISLQRYCSSLEKLSSFRKELNCLEEVGFDLCNRGLIDQNLSFLKYCGNLKFKTLQLQGIKYKYSLYDTKYREESSNLLQFLRKNPMIKNLKFEMFTIHGKTWERFFQNLPKSITGLYVSLQDVTDHLKIIDIREGKRIIYNSVMDMPHYGAWTTLNCIQNCFHHIKRLEVDDDIFMYNGVCPMERIPHVVNVYEKVKNSLLLTNSIKEFCFHHSTMDVTSYNLKMTETFFSKLNVLEIENISFDCERTLKQFIGGFIAPSILREFKKLCFEVVIVNDNKIVSSMFLTAIDQVAGVYDEILKWNSYSKKNKKRFSVSSEIVIDDPDDPRNTGRKEVRLRYTRFCAFCGIQYDKIKKRKKRKLKRCSGCLKIFYCSSRCQKSDWKVHKINCKRYN